MLFPPSGYIFPPCIQSPEKSLATVLSKSGACQVLLDMHMHRYTVAPRPYQRRAGHSSKTLLPLPFTKVRL